MCQLAVSAVGNDWSHGDDDHRTGILQGESPEEAARQTISRPVTDGGALAVLAEALTHEDSCVRRAAASMLGESGETQAVRLLRNALRQGNPRVREAAALGLADAEAVPARGRSQ